MNTIEIQRQRVKELKLLIGLHQLVITDFVPRFRYGPQSVFQSLLTRFFKGQHFFGRGKVLFRDLVQQYEIRQSIAPVVEPPGMHAR